MLNYPIKFEPILKQKIWGGDKLVTKFNKKSRLNNIGESWEISDVKDAVSIVENGYLKGKSLKELLETYKSDLLGKINFENFGTNFPLLIKFIDAKQDLSVQVHPNDALSKKRHDSFGKTEMWYIMQAEEDSRLILGFNKKITTEDYKKLLGEKRIMSVLNEVSVEKGNAFFIKTGTVHAIGAGIVLANASIFLFQDWFGVAETVEATSGIPKWLYYSFFIGAILSVSTILWSVLKTPEIPPSDQELKNIKKHNALSLKDRIKTPFLEIVDAIKVMPKFMWKLAAVYLFQWYALFVYWQFIAPMFKESMGFNSSEALSQAAKMNTTYNLSTIVFALALVPLALKFGGKKVYVFSLFLTGIAMISIPYIQDPLLVILPMILFGIGWAAMMGIPYSMVSKIVPQERRGVYMGILNMMIVIPMGIQTVTFGPVVKNLLNNSAVNAILFGGIFFIIAGVLALRLKEPKTDDSDENIVITDNDGQ